LSYDFFLPEYNLLIEYQGEQHEKYIKGFHKNKKAFINQQEHDKRKREYAKNHNIKLLEIWYYDFDNIEQILDKELQLNQQLV
jgi:very-short-patch-repair endonuclease